MAFRLIAFITLLTSSIVWATDTKTSLDQLVPPIPSWVEDQPPTVTPSGTWDWIQLDTNEWVKGEITALYDGDLEFDSDNFDGLTLDWADVIEVRTNRKYRIGLDKGEARLLGSIYDAQDDEEMIIGTLYINQKTAYITGDNGQTWTIDRSNILTITTGQPREANYWKLKATAGATIKSGNTESVDYNIYLGAKRRTVNSRVLADYNGYLSELDKEKTADNHRVKGSYDIFQTKNFFYRPIYIEYYLSLIHI